LSALVETGSGVGASSLLVALIGTGEAGLGSEFAAKAFSAMDSGSGIDAVVARLLAATETGSALEAALLSGAVPKAVLAGDDGSYIRFAVDNGASGIVIAGVGAGLVMVNQKHCMETRVEAVLLWKQVLYWQAT